MKFWSECTEKLEAKLSQEEFNTWIKPLKADIKENNLEISAPNDFVLTYVKDNLGQIIESLVNKSDESLTVKFKKLDKSTFVEKLNVTEEIKPGLVKILHLIHLWRANQTIWPWPQQNRWQQTPRETTTPCLYMGALGWEKPILCTQ